MRRRWRLDLSRLSYGGLKDRHAQTVQYLTVRHGPRRGTGESSMRPPEGVKRGFVVQWIRSADGDLAAAKHLLGGGAEFVRGAVFHAQQAVEKFLKAVGAVNSSPAPTTTRDKRAAKFRMA